MNCSICKEKVVGGITTINLAAMEAKIICPKCQAKAAANYFKTIEAIDEQVANMREVCERMETLIKESPEMPDVPKELEAYAMTPLTMYRSMMYFMAELESRKMEIITEKDSRYRLEYALEQSLAAEDYEKSAQLRDKLKALDSKKVREKSHQTEE